MEHNKGPKNESVTMRDELVAQVATMEAETEMVIDVLGRTGNSLEDIRNNPNLNYRLGQITIAKEIIEKLDANVE